MGFDELVASILGREPLADLALGDARERRVVLVAVAGRDEPLLLLGDEAGDRHRQAVAVRLGERDPAGPSGAARSGTRAGTRPAITFFERFWRIHEPAAPPLSAATSSLERQALALGQREPLAERRVGAGDQHLVDGLAGLSRAGRAEVRDRAREDLAAQAARPRRAASSPPTKTVSVPLRAPSDPPETGASTAPQSLRRRASRRSCADVPGETVEQSTSTAPGRMLAMRAARPSTTASRSGESETHVNTRSAPWRPRAGRRGAGRAGRGERLLTRARAVVDVQLVACGEQVPRHGRTHRSETDPGDSHAGQ